MSGVTEAVVRFARDFDLAALSSPIREVGRVAILDTFACAIGGVETRVAAAARGLALDEGSAQSASVWGTRHRVSAGRAALANGAAAHALDYDDVSWAMNGHPSAPLLPAAVALAERRGASGAELLSAYVAGFEVEARLGQAMGRSHYARGWHPTSTLGTLGATVAAGCLLGLEEEALKRALGIACSTLAGSRMNFGTDTKPLHAGFAAQAGVLAVDLAARGVTSCPDALDAEMGLADLYDGEQPLEIERLGSPFALEDPGVELKPYPSCRFTHRIIDGVLAVRKRHPGVGVRRIECAVDPFALKILIHPRPTDGLQAKFSLGYCAAVAWLDGWPTVESFSDERVSREDVQTLLRQVEVRETSGPGEEVVFGFESNGEDRERVRHARGNPERPLSRDEHLHKVRSLCEPVLGRARTQALIEAALSIDSLGHVAELTRNLVPGEAT